MNKPDYSDPDLPAGVKQSDIDREPNPLTVEDALICGECRLYREECHCECNSKIAALTAENERLKAKVKDMGHLLKEIEFIGDDFSDRCLFCNHSIAHNPVCRLAAALKEEK